MRRIDRPAAAVGSGLAGGEWVCLGQPPARFAGPDGAGGELVAPAACREFVTLGRLPAERRLRRVVGRAAMAAAAAGGCDNHHDRPMISSTRARADARRRVKQRTKWADWRGLLLHARPARPDRSDIGWFGPLWVPAGRQSVARGLGIDAIDAD